MPEKKHPAKGDYAEGERTKPRPDEQPDYAQANAPSRGPMSNRTSPGTNGRNRPRTDFARGERKTDD